jgi:hypothetical protein
MKKIRIDLKQKRYRYFYFFDSVEALYMWLSSNHSMVSFIDENPDSVSLVELTQDGQFLEIEWMGAEYTIYGTLHFVRAVKASIDQFGESKYAIYAGWIHNDYLRFNNAEDEDIRVKRIDLNGEIDIDRLFLSPEVHD